ncbi:MAG: hypothetical protein ACRDZN_14375, partial [Acidimicrobiales bacterium]
VVQFQNAVRSLGISTGGAADGEFGEGTKDAVEALYERLGYEVPTTGSETELDAARTAVATAEDALALAQTATSPTTGGAPSSNAVTGAERALDQARQQYADLLETTGPMVPLTEYTFVPLFPAVVVDIGAEIGESPAGDLVTLASGALVVRGELNPADATMVPNGTPVTIESFSGAKATGKASIARVVEDDAGGAAPPDGTTPEGSTPSSGDEGAPTQSSDGGQAVVTVVVTPDKKLDPALIGQDVQLVIASARSSGEVLAVPESALATGADGSSYVTKAIGDNGEDAVKVVVEAGISGGGLVEVQPVEQGSLVPGDEVVVGERAADAGEPVDQDDATSGEDGDDGGAG